MLFGPTYNENYTINEDQYIMTNFEMDTLNVFRPSGSNNLHIRYGQNSVFKWEKFFDNTGEKFVLFSRFNENNFEIRVRNDFFRITIPKLNMSMNSVRLGYVSNDKTYNFWGYIDNFMVFHSR